MKIQVHTIDWYGGWMDDYGVDDAIDILKKLPTTIEMEVDESARPEDYLPEIVEEYIQDLVDNGDLPEDCRGTFPNSCKYAIVEVPEKEKV